MKSKIKAHIESHLAWWYAGTILVIIIALLSMVYITVRVKDKEEFVFKEHLEEIIVSVGDKEVKLKDIAYYILVVESNINAYAVEYDENNPIRLWNTVTDDGERGYVRVKAKEDVMDACVRDVIYYEAALSHGIELTDEEVIWCEEWAYEQERLLTGKQLDFCQYDYADMYAAVERTMILTKYMSELMKEGYTEKELDTGGEYYEKVAADYKVEVNEEIWEKISLGELTIN